MLSREPAVARVEVSELPDVRQRIGGIRGTAAGQPPLRLLHDVRRVVIVSSASRGGSSVVAEVLRRSGAVLSLRGEISPWLALHGLTFPASGRDSDALFPEDTPSGARLEALDQDLTYDCGTPDDRLDSPEAVWQFASDIAVRLALQWPQCSLPIERVHDCVCETLSALHDERGWREGRFEDAGVFYSHFLFALHRWAREIDPLAYDVSGAPWGDRALASRRGPPGQAFVEEPPFIAVTPWRRPDRIALRTQALVIKTPSNAYRLAFLRRLFPRASFAIVHLTRNAAASINGLYDGWKYDGFYSHPLPASLSIRGYSDVYPEWGTRWWKFDLPPGWRERRALPLERVCAWQWCSAHDAILRYIEEERVPPADVRTVRFEDVMSPERRGETLSSLLRWCGAGEEEALRESERPLPTVMATQRPTPGRWRARNDILDPLLRTPAVRDMMGRLGYAEDCADWS